MANDGAVQYLYGGRLFWKGVVTVEGVDIPVNIDLSSSVRLDEFKHQEVIDDILQAIRLGVLDADN